VLKLSERTTERTTARAADREDRPGRLERRRRRRALREQDRRSAKLAELRQIDALLLDAETVIERGWIQHAWFAYDDPSGTRHAVTTYSGRGLPVDRVAATCLVGAIVHAAGGPGLARSQLVQRTIDLTWHALYRNEHDAVRLSCPQVERAGHVFDLARWNDRPGRDAHDVTVLLDRARAIAQAERDRTQAAALEPIGSA
jgi:hypothetical protein